MSEQITVCLVLTLGCAIGVTHTPRLEAQVRDVTVHAIPGVVAAGAKWTVAWQGTDDDKNAPMLEAARVHGGNADGLVGTSDGGLIFAQEQSNEIRKIDKNGKVSITARNTHGSGSVTIDARGRLIGAARTCTDPGGKPDECKEPTAIAFLTPEYKVIADNFQGKSFGRLNDLIADKKGGIYFNGDGTWYVDAAGKVSSIGQNIRSNGMALSRDGKTFYVTNGKIIVAFDVQVDGTATNQRNFAKLEGGGNGDGMAIDSDGRLYVSSQTAGIQAFSSDAKYLGAILTPREVVSVAFSGPWKKTLFMVGRGATGPDGKEFETPPGVRNNVHSIYKIQMLARGLKGRAK